MLKAKLADLFQNFHNFFKTPRKNIQTKKINKKPKDFSPSTLSTCQKLAKKKPAIKGNEWC